MPQPHNTPAALVLEDEPRFRALLGDVLRTMDCRPILAATADEADRAIAADPPAMLLLDLNLPVTDGMTYFERFRRGHPDTPVLIITGFGDLPSAKRAIHLGVTDFLTKPCDLGQLELAIDRARRRIPAPPTPQAPPIPSAQPAAPTSGLRSLAQIERDAILAAMRGHNNNRSAAARSLGLSRRALYNKLDEYRASGHTVD
jgi:two-component system response regulator PilR (NtrC family)